MELNANYLDEIRKKKFFYKMGVLCGKTLYATFKFNDFDRLIKSASDTSQKYGRDMFLCRFVIQAFSDSSYDFDTSCFSQVECPVNRIALDVELIAKMILGDYKNGT